MSLLLASCGQSIGASTSTSVLPMNVQGWFPLGLTVLISSEISKSLLFMLSDSVVSDSSWILWTWLCQAPLYIGFFHTWILEWVAISCPRGSFQPRDQTHVSCVFCISRQVLYYWATWEAPESSPAPHLKASVLPHSAFSMVQLSYQYLTTGKTIALTIWTFVGKWCLLSNTLSRFVITTLLKSKYLSIAWLWSPFTVILESKKIKSATVFTFSPSMGHEVLG